MAIVTQERQIGHSTTPSMFLAKKRVFQKIVPGHVAQAHCVLFALLCAMIFQKRASPQRNATLSLNEFIVPCMGFDFA